MSFDTLAFAVFLCGVFALWWAFEHIKPLRALRGWVLLLGSIGFYVAAGPRDLAIAGFLLVANWALSFLVVRDRRNLWMPVVLNLGFLGFFKYRDFLSGGMIPQDLYGLEILIPLGISFYSFQMIAYQVDLVRGQAKHEPSLHRFALFVIFFPQLIAGPIVRASRLMPQVLHQHSQEDAHRRNYGIALALIAGGVLKKVLLADSISPHVDQIFREGPTDAAAAWLGALLFSFQIYFDFSGYSDMAVGLGRMFGVRLPFNFKQPYLSRSPREFWQRWHITLSTWIKDYLYIPLGGSRVGGPWRQAAVMVTAMGLSGLWHGANSTFIVWGVAWGLFVAGWRVFDKRLGTPGIPHWALTMLVTVILWVFFRAPTVGMAFRYIGAMFGGPGLGTYAVPAGFGLWASLGLLALFGLHALERRANKRDVARWLHRHEGPLLAWALVGLIFGLLLVPKPDVSPFIYFRF